MTDREYRLRVRIDQLTDQRDRARALHLKWRRRAQSLERQYERWRLRALQQAKR
jgi:hypothetical protein